VALAIVNAVSGSILVLFVHPDHEGWGYLILELLIVWPSDQSYPFYERAGFRRETDPLVPQICAEN